MEVPPRRRFARRELLLLAVSFLLLLLATLPPLINLGRYQRRIAVAISRSIGRPVSMDSISLRLLPWPAFQIANLAVGEDPRFGAEPTLRAPEVVLEPRLSSLWRGRFELSRVELTDASVNLVRAGDGSWNVSSVLLQASQVPNAPTAQPHAGPSPRFPYIDATGARINIKRGVEKLPYSLLDADFTMYLTRPEVWQLRLQGKPVRTDLDLSLDETGLLRVEGELHRASALGSMPLSLQGSWSGAPLGQLSRLLLGRDAGWRGEIDLSAEMLGTIDGLDVRSRLRIANLHRQEFTPAQLPAVDAHCGGHYSRSEAAANALLCRWPLGGGALLLEHEANHAAGEIALGLDQLPASFAALLVGVVRPGLPAPESYSGALSGRFVYSMASGRLLGAASSPLLTIAGPDGPLEFHDLQAQAAGSRSPELLLTAEPVAAGIAFSGELTERGYLLHAGGSGTVGSVRAAARALHLPDWPQLSAQAPNPELPAAPDSTAQLALTLQGPWLGGDGAEATGTAHLENVRWQPRWLPIPIDLRAADAALSPDSIHWTVPAATLGTEHPLRFAGDVLFPRHCGPPADCSAQFALRSAALDAGTLQTALRGNRERLLRALLARVDPNAPALPALAGTIHADLLTLGRLPVRDASLTLASGGPDAPVAIKSLDGQALGGSVHLEGLVSLAGGSPHYQLQVRAAGANAAEAAALWHESWGGGTLGGTAELAFSGADEKELLAGATGHFRLTWQRGALGTVLPRFNSWDGTGTLDAQGLLINRSSFAGTPATLSGRVGWDRALALEFFPLPDAPPQAIGGTLAGPLRTPAP